MRSFSGSLDRNKFWQAFNLFSLRQRKKLFALGVIQVLLGLIDITAVALLALLGKIAVTGIQSRQTSGITLSILQSIGIDNLGIQKQALIIGTSALSLMMTRSVFSILIIRKSLKAIAVASSEISSTLISKVFNINQMSKIGLEPQEILYSLTQGTTLLTIGIIGTFVTIIGDIGLVILMFLGISVINPNIAVISFFIFCFTSLVLSKYLHGRAVNLGSETAKLNVESNRLILETVQLHTDLDVRNRLGAYAQQISFVREKLMETNRQLVFMPNISKYVFETTILLSAFLLAGFEFYRSDAPSAVASLTLFMASGSRVVPALVRAQQGLVNIKTNLAASEETLKLISIVKLTNKVDPNWSLLSPEHRGFRPTVEIKNGNFAFSLDSKFALKNINLEIPTGKFVALVGRSGAGKSTLIDLILGAKDFDSGDIHISNVKPQQAVMKWTGAIAYVPQNVKLIEATLRSNLLLGFTSDEISDKHLTKVLSSLGLEMLISRKNGLDTNISQFGNSLSGGQIQRIGIARALISNPRLLILDEATSALDAETENVVSNLLKTLHGDVTIIVVAHRLSTVKNADCLYWMENGEIVSSGTFENLRKNNADFESNLKLLGI